MADASPMVAGRVGTSNPTGEHRWATPTAPAEVPLGVRALLGQVLAATPDVIAVKDRDQRYLVVNAACAAVIGAPEEAIVGRTDEELYPADVAAALRTVDQRVIATGETITTTEWVPSARDGGAQRAWTSVKAPLRAADGTIMGVVVTARDETMRHAAERHLQVLLAVDDALRPLGDPDAIVAAATAVLGRALAVGRANYTEIDEAAATLRVRQSFTQDVRVAGAGMVRMPDAVGTYALADFAPLLSSFRAGAPVVITDTHADPRTAPIVAIPAIGAVGTRALLDVPLVKDGALVGVLSVNHPEPRVWTADEVRLVAAIAERAWAVVERARAECALAAREAHLAGILAGIGEGLVAFDHAWRYTYVNAPAAALLGTTPEALLGRTPTEAFPDVAEPMDGPSWRELRRVMATREPEVFESHLAAWDRWFENRVYPTADGGLLLFFRDVTAEKARGLALAASEALARDRLAELEAVYQAAPVGMCVLDRALRYVRINERLAEINGLSAAAHLGKTVAELLPDLAATAEATLRRILETGEALHDVEFRGTTPAQPGVERIWVEQWLPLRDAGGTIVGVHVVADEVTAERRLLAERERLLVAEQAARADAERAGREADLERRRLLTIIEQLPVGVHVAEAPSGRLVLDNPAVRAICGEAPASARVEDYSVDYVGFHPSGHPRAGTQIASNEWPLARALSSGAPVRDELVEIRRADGTTRLVSVTATPIRDAAGVVVGGVATNVDVTERAALIAALDAERTRLSAVFEQAPVFVAVLRGPAHVVERVNRAYYDVVGHRDLVGRPLAEALPEVTAQGFIDVLDRVLASGEPFVGTGVAARLQRAPDAPLEERFVDFVYAPLTEADGTRSGVVAIGSDVTERVHAERAQAAAREAVDLERRRLDAVLAALPVGVIVVEAPSGRVVYLNEAMQRIWGQAPLTPRVEDYSADWVGYHVEAGPAGPVPTDRPIASHEWPVARVVRTGVAVLDELLVAERPDGTRRMVSISVAPIHDAAGQLVGAAATVADVDEAYQTRAALETARIAAEAASRAKSEFLANMSHELRTPLNAIQGHVQLLEMGLHGPLSEAQQTALARVQRAQQHLLGLINDVLNYAKLEAGKVTFDVRAVTVREVVRDVLPMIEPQLAAKGLTLDVRLPAELGEAPVWVWADREKLAQVLLNLLANAVKFTPAVQGDRAPAPGAAGRITIDVATRARTPELAYLRVTDTGVGIPRAKQDAIFEPFVQVSAGLTRQHEGTGLGLAISRDLTRGMGGELRVRSAEGRGSTFTVTLRRVTSVHGDPVDRRAGDERRVDDERRSGVDRRDGDGPVGGDDR